VSRSLIVECVVAVLCARPVNSSVRFLLNAQARRLRSMVLNLERLKRSECRCDLNALRPLTHRVLILWQDIAPDGAS
jgi:hypothetical protein